MFTESFSHHLSFILCFVGYNLSPQALNITVKRYSTDSRISFDNFIAIAVRLRLMTGMLDLTMSDCCAISADFFVTF